MKNMVEALYAELWEELAGWCRSMTGDRTLAEELVQEAFMRALLHEEELTGLNPQQRRAWMYRTVKNLFFDHRRREKRQAALEEAAESAPEILSIDPGFSEREWMQLLARLPETERVLIVMRYLQGYNSTQIGQILELPPGTVRTKLASARKHLKEMIGG